MPAKLKAGFGAGVDVPAACLLANEKGDEAVLLLSALVLPALVVDPKEKPLGGTVGVAPSGTRHQPMLIHLHKS